MSNLHDIDPNSPLSADQLWSEIEGHPAARQTGQASSFSDFQNCVESSADAAAENLQSCGPQESADLAPQDSPQPWSADVDTFVQLGFLAIPLDPETGKPAVSVEDWMANYTLRVARDHFVRHPEHMLALVIPEDILAFQTESQTVEAALWQLLRETGSAPLLRLQAGDSKICVFKWAREGRLSGSLAVSQGGAGQIAIHYPDTILRITDPEQVVAACNVESFAELHEIDASKLAMIHAHNRKAVTAALEGKEQTEQHPLGRYSLRGQSEKIKQEIVSAVDVLPGIARRGQSTMLFAAPNTGKTLIVLYLIIQAIKAGLLEPSDLYYVNVDDNTEGLYEKLLLAEKYGFHMLSEGYQGYQAKNFADQVHALIKSGAAPRTVVILDTLKRFASDILDKRKNSDFTGLMRLLSLKGGTVIALGHVNKKKDKNGKSIYSGTSDLLDDVDCGFVIDEVDGDRTEQRKLVEFRREKGRGGVAERLAFSYSVEDDQTYAELLASVEEIDPASLEPIRQAATLESDMPVVKAIEASIRAGQNAKMAIINSVAAKVRVSQRNVGTILERYMGEDPAQHRWTYSVGERGAKLYVLLVTDQPDQSD